MIKKIVFLAIIWGFYLSEGSPEDLQPPKFSITGEFDLGGTYDSVSGTTTDKPTQLKLSPTLKDGNIGFNSRFFFFSSTANPSVTANPLPVSMDYAYGTYLIYGSLFDQFMTLKLSIGNFADLTDYVLNYNSSGFSLLVNGNPIGGYIEGITGAEAAFSPFKNLTLAVFVPWDNTGIGEPVGNTIEKTDINISYSYPKIIKINMGYGNSYNGDISGLLIQPNSGVNLYYANLSLSSVKNLTLGVEYGNYFDVVNKVLVENYLTMTMSLAFPNEKTGDSLTLSNDFFCFIPASGTSVIQEYFSLFYTFSQVISSADIILDLDIDYADNYPGTDSTNANALIASHKNITINPWIKLSFGSKNHLLALGYAYNYDIDDSLMKYSKVVINGSIYF